MRARGALLAGLFLAALALRPQVVGIGPLVPRIQDDLSVSHSVAGLLATIPVLCMGLFAPPATYLSARLGSRLAVTGCLAAIAGFGIVRGVMPSAALVVVATLPIGIGMGLAGALMPVAVKERFADRPAFATGVYVTGINLGSAASSALAAPLAGAGGWRTPLLAFSSTTAGLLVFWLLLSRDAPSHRRGLERPLGLPWRSTPAWRLVGLFALLGTIFYGLNAWLPDAFVERGWSEGRAGALVAVLNICALPVGFLVPFAADRFGSRRLYLTAGSSLVLVGLLGLALAPGAGLLWAGLTGVAIGGTFPIVMTLPLDVSEVTAEVGAAAGLMLGAGYTLCAVSPAALGALRDLTGSFTATLWVLAATAATLVALCFSLSRERLGAAALTGPAVSP